MAVEQFVEQILIVTAHIAAKRSADARAVAAI
jgi:hypothetical protein